MSNRREAIQKIDLCLFVGLGDSAALSRWGPCRCRGGVAAAPQGQLVEGNAGPDEGRTRILSQCPPHLRLPLIGSILLERPSEKPLLERLGLPLILTTCLFSETCAILPPKRQCGYKRGWLSGCKLGEMAPQNRFLIAVAQPAA